MKVRELKDFLSNVDDALEVKCVVRFENGDLLMFPARFTTDWIGGDWTVRLILRNGPGEEKQRTDAVQGAIR